MTLPTPSAEGHTGPFSTEREARAAAHAAIPPEDGWSILHRDQNRLLLERACNAAGVELGTFDRRILDWISGFEDSSCMVVAGLIERAAEGAAKGSASDADHGAEPRQDGAR